MKTKKIILTILVTSTLCVGCDDSSTTENDSYAKIQITNITIIIC